MTSGMFISHSRFWLPFWTTGQPARNHDFSVLTDLPMISLAVCKFTVVIVNSIQGPTHKLKNGVRITLNQRFYRDPKTKQQPSNKKLWLEYSCAAYYPPPTFYKGPVHWYLTTRQHAWKWRELMRLIPAIEKRPVMRVSAVLRVVGAGGLPWLSSLWLTGPDRQPGNYH